MLSPLLRISESSDEVVFQLECGIRFKVSPQDQRFILGLTWTVINRNGKYPYIQCTTKQSPHYGKLLHSILCSSSDIVDHWDHDTLNNRRDNLRPATRSQNNCNAYCRDDNTTGMKGITFHKATQKYYARIQVNNNRIDLGCHDTLEAAAKAYSDAATKYHQEFRNNG